MFRAYKYRIYPDEQQKELLEKHFGCARFIYNFALETKSTSYLGSKKSLSFFELNKQLTDLKKDCSFLRDVHSQSLQMALRNLYESFKNFLVVVACTLDLKRRVGRNRSSCRKAYQLISKTTVLNCQSSKNQLKRYYTESL